eukprot:scaffold226774_cov24-Tisochrysis_lutea.AAC.2
MQVEHPQELVWVASYNGAPARWDSFKRFVRISHAYAPSSPSSSLFRPTPTPSSSLQTSRRSPTRQRDPRPSTGLCTPTGCAHRRGSSYTRWVPSPSPHRPLDRLARRQSCGASPNR